MVSCSSDDTKSKNSFLPNINVNFQINLNLPEYNNLKFPGGVYEDKTEGRGIKGVVIYNINDQQYSAFELSDPNILPSECSALRIEGVEAYSNCGNDNVYEIINGQQIKGTGGYPLLRYQIRKEGNTLFITN